MLVRENDGMVELVCMQMQGEGGGGCPLANALEVVTYTLLNDQHRAWYANLVGLDLACGMDWY